MKVSDEFWASLKENSARLEHARNLRGKTTTRCAACTNGYEREGFTDCDGSGSFWVPGVPCRNCGGHPRSLEVPCSPEVEAAAIKVEIGKLQARLRELRKKVARGKE